MPIFLLSSCDFRAADVQTYRRTDVPLEYLIFIGFLYEYEILCLDSLYVETQIAFTSETEKYVDGMNL